MNCGARGTGNVCCAHVAYRTMCTLWPVGAVANFLPSTVANLPLLVVAVRSSDMSLCAAASSFKRSLCACVCLRVACPSWHGVCRPCMANDCFSDRPTNQLVCSLAFATRRLCTNELPPHDATPRRCPFALRQAHVLLVFPLILLIFINPDTEHRLIPLIPTFLDV